ncbi:hypothetical protein PS634_01357 [Pseudomonas fluorescens]|nr:hypothetical protein PS634_01357 [Pseudomonas fluorescens]
MLSARPAMCGIKLSATTCLRFCKYAYVVFGFFLELEWGKMKSKLEEAFREAAHAADRAVSAAMLKYADGLVTDEDDITGALIGRLDSAFDEKIGGITWSSSILRHRKGVAAQEKKAGADMLFHVSIQTPQLTYSKGVLIQSKRIDECIPMPVIGYKELLGQCDKMLDITSASFVFNYTKSGMRCASATKIAGTSSRILSDSCNLTSYRFFLELFRCTIGDRRITSAKFDDLWIPQGIAIKGILG